MMTDATSRPDVKPPLPQAVEKALQVLLDSISEENEYHASGPSTASESAEIDIVQIIQWQREVLRQAHTTLARESRIRMARFGLQSNSLMPINKLPFELTADILLLSLKPDDHRDLSRLQALSRVQTSWWNVIRTSPAFWTVLYTGNVDVEDLKLQKSGGLPLEIFCSRPWKGTTPEEFFEELEEHRHRIRTFHYSLGDPRPLREFFESPMPILEHLKLLMFQNGPPIQLVDFRGGPSLRRIDLDSASLRWDPGMVLSRLETLIMLTFHIPTTNFTALSDALSSCSQLQHLEMEHIETEHVNGTIAPTLTEHIFLPKLQTLSLISVTALLAVPLLALIHTNCLTKFVLDYEGNAGCELIGRELLDKALPPPSFASMFTNPALGARTVVLEVRNHWIDVRAEFKGKGEVTITLLRDWGTFWLRDISRMQHLSLSNCGVPLRVEVLDQERGDHNFGVDVSNFTGATSMVLQCGPTLSCTIVRALSSVQAPGGGTIRWPCRRLSELHLGHGSRSAWRAQSGAWTLLKESMKALMDERGSELARAAGVAKLTLYDSRPDQPPESFMTSNRCSQPDI